MRNVPVNLGQGQAGVYTVAAQLLLRGINPCFPAVDIGADIITDRGIRIQVKSARKSRYKVYPDGAYWFNLDGKKVRQFSNECDFVVLWGVDEHRFWIIPAALLDGHCLVVVGPESRWVDVDIEQIRVAREQKIPYRDIAKSLNLSLGTIHRSLNGRNPSATTSLTSSVRECENRWDSIEAYYKTLDAAESVQPETVSEEK